LNVVRNEIGRGAHEIVISCAVIYSENCAVYGTRPSTIYVTSDTMDCGTARKKGVRASQ